MRQPEAFAFAGDWHGNTHWAVSAIDAVAENGADTILHLGDYGYTFEDEFVEGIEKACAENEVMLYFVDGNHDLHEFLWALPPDEDGFLVLSEHVRYIPRGHRWEWWGVDFMGLGGATSVDKDWRKPYTEWWPTESINSQDIITAIFTDDGPGADPVPVDVMIAHDCPSGVPIPGISLEQGIQNGFPAHSLVEADAHREVLRGVVDAVKPKLYVHGHYHRMYVHESSEDGCKYVGLDMDGMMNEDGGTPNLWLIRSREQLGVGFE